MKAQGTLYNGSVVMVIFGRPLGIRLNREVNVLLVPKDCLGVVLEFKGNSSKMGGA